MKPGDSYRKIPVHPRYRLKLITLKERQQKIFKSLHIQWSEDCPIFLNQYHRAFVPENLSKSLNTFRKKFNLEYLTPYGLRHSFATYMSEHGMKDVVLMKLMGHSEFKTTQKYYIFVSDARKKKEYEIAFGLVPPQNENSIDNSIKKENNMNITLSAELKQLQELWLSTLISSTLVQKNNAI